MSCRGSKGVKKMFASPELMISSAVVFFGKVVTIGVSSVGSGNGSVPILIPLLSSCSS